MIQDHRTNHAEVVKGGGKRENILFLRAKTDWSTFLHQTNHFQTIPVNDLIGNNVPLIDEPDDWSVHPWLPNTAYARGVRLPSGYLFQVEDHHEAIGCGRRILHGGQGPSMW